MVTWLVMPPVHEFVTFSVSRVLLSKMKEMQLRTTSSLRALLNTEPLLPMMDTEIQKDRQGEESLQVEATAAANIRTYFADTRYVKAITVGEI